MTPELQIIDIHQDMIVSLNEEVDGLHDALGILRAEIEELQIIITELKAENIRLKHPIKTWSEIRELYYASMG